MHMADIARRYLLLSLAVLLVACWLGGGVTVDDTTIDEWLQLLALPVLLLAVVALQDEPNGRFAKWGMLLAVLIAAVPAVQLLPLPESIWLGVPARAALAQDLALEGVRVVPHWTLTPNATERSLWALLPALASFLGALALLPEQRRRLLQVIVGIVLFNVLFAFFQAGLPRDSGLRLYQDFDAGFGGLLANTNHQATACIIGMAIAVGLAAEARLRAQRGQTTAHRHWWYWALALFFLLMVPLSTSRAGMTIALPTMVLALLITRTLRLRKLFHSKRGMAAAVVLLVFAVAGVHAALGWMAVDQAEELRHTMSMATIALGQTHAPLGSGVGSFVPVFEQAIPKALQLSGYVNHAHNEYAQWWLTAGWLGMVVLLLVLLLLAACGWRVLRSSKGRHAAVAGACLAALCGILAHSTAEYPLRTLALMATAAALAGVMLAALDQVKVER